MNTHIKSFLFIAISVFAGGCYSADGEDGLDGAEELVGEADEALASPPSGICVQGHIQDVGWGPVNCGAAPIVGVAGKRLEAVRIQAQRGMGVCYQVHVANKGWLPEVCNSAIAGTTGDHIAIEAIKIRLTGTSTRQVWYRGVFEGTTAFGGWFVNGAMLGSTGRSIDMQRLQVQLF